MRYLVAGRVVLLLFTCFQSFVFGFNTDIKCIEVFTETFVLPFGTKDRFAYISPLLDPVYTGFVWFGLVYGYRNVYFKRKSFVHKENILT